MPFLDDTGEQFFPVAAGGSRIGNNHNRRMPPDEVHSLGEAMNTTEPPGFLLEDKLQRSPVLRAGVDRRHAKFLHPALLPFQKYAIAFFFVGATPI
jgi:hypothetical protein